MLSETNNFVWITILEYFYRIIYSHVFSKGSISSALDAHITFPHSRCITVFVLSWLVEFTWQKEWNSRVLWIWRNWWEIENIWKKKELEMVRRNRKKCSRSGESMSFPTHEWREIWREHFRPRSQGFCPSFFYFQCFIREWRILEKLLLNYGQKNSSRMEFLVWIWQEKPSVQESDMLLRFLFLITVTFHSFSDGMGRNWRNWLWSSHLWWTQISYYSVLSVLSKVSIYSYNFNPYSGEIWSILLFIKLETLAVNVRMDSFVRRTADYAQENRFLRFEIEINGFNWEIVCLNVSIGALWLRRRPLRVAMMRDPCRE